VSKAGPVHLPPAESDLVIARAAARMTTPSIQRALRAITLLADEKAVLGAALITWLVSRSRLEEDREEANKLMCCVLVAGALPHLFKLIVQRKRPNRSVGRHTNGIARSGDPWDSFPSGHAVHLGAVAPSIIRLAPPSVRPLVWPAVLSLSATRILLLAHYPSDVAAGLGIGLAIDKAIRWIADGLRERMAHASVFPAIARSPRKV
jgi:undecaprenyl-diphosphatase